MLPLSKRLNLSLQRHEKLKQLHLSMKQLNPKLLLLRKHQLREHPLLTLKKRNP